MQHVTEAYTSCPGAKNIGFFHAFAVGVATGIEVFSLGTVSRYCHKCAAHHPEAYQESSTLRLENAGKQKPQRRRGKGSGNTTERKKTHAVRNIYTTLAIFLGVIGLISPNIKP